jgi:Salmonella virulence plasmid 65kDa B protein
MSHKSGTTSGSGISVPKGGGALHGIGEKFSPDLHTGTGNFSVPIALPPGRNGLQPQLNLAYSTGSGNGPFGLGWGLSVPGVSRQTSQGIPRYVDAQDTFILSGAEDLVPVEQQPGMTYYRPRTEGLFARIEHHHADGNDFWKVWNRDGLISFYGTPRPPDAAPDWQDTAVVADPKKREKIFAWKLSQTIDTFGNRIDYEYMRDTGEDGQHHWDQLYVKRIRYDDYTEQGATQYLVSVTFAYEDRPDALSEYCRTDLCHAYNALRQRFPRPSSAPDQAHAHLGRGPHPAQPGHPGDAHGLGRGARGHWRRRVPSHLGATRPGIGGADVADA